MSFSSPQPQQAIPLPSVPEQPEAPPTFGEQAPQRQRKRSSVAPTFLGQQPQAMPQGGKTLIGQ